MKFFALFIYRPVATILISLAITLCGILGFRLLPVAPLPQVDFPVIMVSASLPGASPETMASSVATPLERSLGRIAGVNEMTSSSSLGSTRIILEFNFDRDINGAARDVQAAINAAQSLLPSGMPSRPTYRKANPSDAPIMILTLTSDTWSQGELYDFASTQLAQTIAQIDGVGDVDVGGSSLPAVRVDLNPQALFNQGVSLDAVRTAISNANVRKPQGALEDATHRWQVATNDELKTAAEYQPLIVHYNNGAAVRLGDVANVTDSVQDVRNAGMTNARPAILLMIRKLPEANIIETVDSIRARLPELQRTIPASVDLQIAQDRSPTIRASLEEVEQTLVISVALVILVVFLFLRSGRATLIPAVAVPVVLLGTFGVLALFGYSINTLTLFAMVLAIGLLVDDAIVVVENVERIMRDEGLPAREATEKSMGEISGALIAIALVLSAVFLPMAFFGGSTGVIYRQFSVTIISAMMLSVVVALTLTPALCGALLSHSKPHTKGFFGAFNRLWGRTEQGYQHRVVGGLRRSAMMMGAFALICGGMALAMWKLPGSFLPTEDQGEIMVQYTLPAGATAVRTAEVRRQVTDWFLTKEKANTDVIFTVDGFSFSGSGQNAGMAFVSLKNWSERKGEENTAQAIALRATKELGSIRDATLFAMTPPSVDGLGQSNGFTFELMASGGTDRDSLMKMRSQLLAAANQSSELQSVRANDLPQMPQLQVDIDNNKAVSLGLSLSDVTDTLSSAWGGTYVNDFIDRGRVKKVYIQGESDARAVPSDLGKWFVRGSDDSMTPFSAFATTRWQYGPESLVRYNGSAAFEIQGENASGFSSGAAMDKMEALANDLPAGTTWAWSGMSLQEKLASGQAMSLYAISILVVFLCLAALYESWSVPFSVIMVIPLGLLGAALAAWMRGLNNDVYFQVALLTTIGLSSKNAILIVEFAESAVEEGYSLSRAAMRAAQTRLRPIVMTSLAFIAGVLPLAIATGAGANSRVAIGTGIIGGTLTATLLAVFFVPLFFVLVKRFFTRHRSSQE